MLDSEADDADDDDDAWSMTDGDACYMLIDVLMPDDDAGWPNLTML
jgi:hypothetical protein